MYKFIVCFFDTKHSVPFIIVNVNADEGCDRELSTRGTIIVLASDSGSYAQILFLLRIERQIM